MASSGFRAEHGELTSAGHHKVVRWQVYALVLVALLILTIITVAVASVHLGRWNTPIALAIAVLKASLVVMFFMNVRNSTPLLRIVVAVGFVWFGIMISLTMSDFLSRDWNQAINVRGQQPGTGVGAPVEGEGNVPGVPTTSPTGVPPRPTSNPSQR